jgi:hypothetical protein
MKTFRKGTYVKYKSGHEYKIAKIVRGPVPPWYTSYIVQALHSGLKFRITRTDVRPVSQTEAQVAEVVDG